MVFEAGETPGGKIQTKAVDGYLLELGPNALLSSDTALRPAVDALELTEAYLPANPLAKNRFIWLDGRSEPIPLGPAGLIKTRLLSAGAKWRLLAEPLVKKRAADESVAHFFARRLGSEVVPRLVDPFIAGVYAGDPDTLSITATFPALKEMEREKGSLVWGGLARLRQARRKATPDTPHYKREMYSFANGLQELPQALARDLGEQLHLGVAANEIAHSGKQWQINGETFDGVIFTLPVPHWPEVGRNLLPEAQVIYVPVAVVHLAYSKEAVRGRTDGFGMLVPSAEGRRILGILFTSSLFQGRAPEDQHLFTVFLGGQRHLWITGESPEILLKVAGQETAELMGIEPSAKPLFTHLHRWNQAIPQYGFEHLNFVSRLKQFEAVHPGWTFAGCYLNGISVGSSFQSGLDAAQRLLSSKLFTGT